MPVNFIAKKDTWEDYLDTTPVVGEDGGVASTTTDVDCDRYADVCFWDELKQCYTVLGEVKSSDIQPLEVHVFLLTIPPYINHGSLPLTS